MNDLIYYAIGDIHGEYEKLIRLHSRIRRNHDIDFPSRPFTLVHLGDYVDRGPDSFEVIDILIKLELDKTVSVINLKGNHEQMMLEAYQTSDVPQKSYDTTAYSFWIKHGGDKTLESYLNAGFREPPAHHLCWLNNLKTYHWDKSAKLVFVHAGLDPNFFPKDGTEKHLWTRSVLFFETHRWRADAMGGARVIHGHTPTKSGAPDIDGDYRRINIDTGACYGGELTAAILAPNETPRFISV